MTINVMECDFRSSKREIIKPDINYLTKLHIWSIFLKVNIEQIMGANKDIMQARRVIL